MKSRRRRMATGEYMDQILSCHAMRMVKRQHLDATFIRWMEAKMPHLSALLRVHVCFDQPHISFAFGLELFGREKR